LLFERAPWAQFFLKNNRMVAPHTLLKDFKEITKIGNLADITLGSIFEFEFDEERQMLSDVSDEFILCDTVLGEKIAADVLQ